MKRLTILIALFGLLASAAPAHEQSLLARVTVYWHSKGSSQMISSAGTRLRPGHCAVDPKKIPYGSKIFFPDGPTVAVDTGPAVVSRKAARGAGRNAQQKAALVVDRFFETKRQALAWASKNPHFMTLRVLFPEPRGKKLAAKNSVPPNDSSKARPTLASVGSAATGGAEQTTVTAGMAPPKSLPRVPRKS